MMASASIAEMPAVSATGLTPESLRRLRPEQLPSVAAAIRRRLISTVTATGGHLGPNLGTVELTIALHRVFESPRDTILFDTGHQTYTHKLLTGRSDIFQTLRQPKGLSGYPCRAESVHDVIENSHASTALAYADGLAKARQLTGQQHRKVVAVIGDGAMTGGMAWEALNNIGAAPDRPVIIVLNDNGRSYAPTVGSFPGMLRRRDGQERFFDDLGFRFLGPVDGHNLADVEDAMSQAAQARAPIVVHVITRKGEGYPPAEADEAERMHAIGALDSVTGAPIKHPRKSWTEVFAEEVADIAHERDDLVAICAAMRDQVGLSHMARAFPHRVFDVGIAEQHAMCCAAGLALDGLHPIVAIYATFLNRGFDQLLLDVALHRLPVTVVLDRAGVTGPDGSSHNGQWDTALLAAIPGLSLASPRDATQLRELLREAVAINAPTAIRYPKSAVSEDIVADRRIGHCDILRAEHDADVLYLPVGPLASACLSAADRLRDHGIAVTVVDPRWTNPLDPQLTALAAAHRLVITAEDNIAPGALGTRLAAELSGTHTRVHTAALPMQFLAHGTRQEILTSFDLDAEGITRTTLRLFSETDAR